MFVTHLRSDTYAVKSRSSTFSHLLDGYWLIFQRHVASDVTSLEFARPL